MSPLHAQYIVVSSSHRPRRLDGGSSASPGKEKRGPSGPRPRPPPISPRDVNRPARLAVDGLGVPETDPDGSPSAGDRQRVGLGPRGGDEALERGRTRRCGPHLERAAVAARLVLDDDRRAERLLEGRALSPKPRRILVLLGRFVLLPAPEEVGPRAGPLGDRLRPGLGPERRVRAPRPLHLQRLRRDLRLEERILRP